MATIKAGTTTFVVRVPGTPPTITPSAGPPAGFGFNSPTIDIDASIQLEGTVGENVAGWTLGFVQLKYIGTNFARYRGATDRDGSSIVTNSNQILCRDTDPGTMEIWYDPLISGTTGPLGTNRLALGTVLPAAKALLVPAHLYDRPGRWWPSVRPNGLVAGRPSNFLHYAVVELLFCTMLVAQDPTGKKHILKHVYWNVIWEQTFKRDGAMQVVLDKKIRLQQNIQHPVHNGTPNDYKFLHKEYDLSLPVSNTVTGRAPRVVEARDWSQG